jgi:hypothetical protein
MHRVPNHGPVYTPSLPCIRPDHRQLGPVVSTLAAACSGVAIITSPSLSSAGWCSTRSNEVGMENERTSCPREVHRGGFRSRDPPVACRDYLNHRHHCHLSALFLANLALRRWAVASVSCQYAIFGTGELVMPISRARLFQEAIDCLCLVRDIRPREGYENWMHADLFIF